MEFTRADQLQFDPRLQLSRVFVEGFYTWIRHICKDKARLTAVFSHMFLLEKFYVAVEGETIAAMTACTPGISPIALDRKEFSRVLGFARGNFSYFILKRHMVRNGYPFPLSPTTGSIEFVATAPEFRQRGLARELLTYVMAQTPFDSYILEVADTNSHAVCLYEGLGFREIRRVKAPKRGVVNFFIYMRKA